MSSLKCDIVKDLLPLYCDGVVSNVTEQEMKAHLENCPDCRAEYQALEAELSMKSGKGISTKDRFVTMMKRQRRKQIGKMGALLAAACVLMGGVFYVLLQVPLVSKGSEEIAISRVYRYDTEEGEKLFVLCSLPVYERGGYRNAEIKVEDGIAVLLLEGKAPVLSRRIQLEDRAGVMDCIEVMDLPQGTSVSSVQFQGEIIWSEEENGNELIPDYVYAWEASEQSQDVKTVYTSVKDQYIGIGDEDGHVMLWNLDGTLLYDGYPGTDEEFPVYYKKL
ncbi:MAG: zf-HC2 domain-containing protein [Lachnospiraceae bacterium]|nr:zf-HC2 domain-containing protein [Lachnospiraceae bacterium]